MFFSVFFLYRKHDVGNDSTIAEWLINYAGGFTKRGIVGEISIFFSSLFSIDIRDTIFYIQTIVLGIYFALLLNFFKNINFNRLILLSIFSPIFILYPIAEIEVLARKELFIFIFFLLYIFIPSNNFSFQNFYKTIILPLGILIWEPIIFFFPFWLSVDIIRNNFKKIDLKFIKNLIFYFPAVILGSYIALNPMTSHQHSEMVNFLKINFNEDCYGACALLESKSTVYDQIADTVRLLSLEVFVRYFLIMLFGFGPLLILIKNYKLKKNNYLLFKIYKNLFIPFLIIISPILILFLMGVDWGRWVNIGYVHSIIFFIFLYKNNFLFPIKNKINWINIKFLSKKVFIFLFIIYCFGWNPKTLLTGDVASFPGYRVPYKIVKFILTN
tara:strand:+ start:240 stop:1394 length:1155 start_codon:yes stop_codon:yes gene_type:complete